MRKSKLIEKLNQIEGDPEIYLSRDAEGNRFEKLCTAQVSYADTWDYDVEIYDKDWHYEDAGFDSEEEWVQFKSDPKNTVIVLWP